MENKEFIAKLNEKMDEYQKLIQLKEKEGILKPSASRTYSYHSNNFLRWCRGEFIPGEKNQDK
ncbi:hypothetical protein AAGS61_08490 [Lysinibacillus sp. KU-BSD001]|uniref:hypothetical protein n=1 Tax=Lysinibacillus sp. KU-BSD001 TaxID=3141328 RepID=UPI0036E33BF1